MRAFGWCFDGLFAGILVACLVLTLWVWYNILSAGFVVRLRGWVFVFVFRGCGRPGLGSCSEVWFGLRLWFLIWFWSGVVWGWLFNVLVCRFGVWFTSAGWAVWLL